MVKPEHSGPLPPHAMSEAELAAIRAPYETLIGFVPPRIMARTDLLARVDPELLRLEEQTRLRAMYPACFDVKTSQLMLFGILLALMETPRGFMRSRPGGQAPPGRSSRPS